MVEVADPCFTWDRLLNEVERIIKGNFEETPEYNSLH